MTITIGTFTCDLLTVQPMGYEGEARNGLTARAFQISGLLTPAQWQSLLGAYNGWRNTRINDQDTLLSKAVGTTIALTVAANGVSVSALPCWFVEAPTGEQTGAYVSTSVTLVDAAQALAVLLREQELAKERQIAEAEDVDCAVIAANLQRQKDETDCELTALQTGLADDFAEQGLLKQKIDAEAQSTAYTAGTANLAAVKTAEADVELLDKEAQLTGRAAKAADIAEADLNLEVQSAEANATVYSTNTAELTALKTAQASIELAEKEAELAGRAAIAADIAAADLDLEVQSTQAQATAFAANTTPLANREKAKIDVELLEYAAKITALTSGTRLENLKTARALDNVYEKYISEDLLNLGTVTLGSATVTLTKPMDTRTDGPQVALTATGTSYITGPLIAHQTRQIEGIITSGTYANVLSWYDTTIASVPAPGSWFPVTTPSASAEPFLISGAKGTRYTVTLEAKKIL